MADIHDIDSDSPPDQGSGITEEGIERLKQNWLDDLCWNHLEGVEGFEEFHGKILKCRDDARLPTLAEQVEVVNGDT